MRLENMHAEDAIFNSYKAAQPAAAATRDNTSPAKQANLSVANDPNAIVGRTPITPAEPTEVVLYGYGPDHEWAAISFYEKVSNGSILEDYERRPPHQRFDLSLALPRSQSQSVLSPAAKAKRNRYFGGDHYIKITFDSQQAADLACHRSPHPINGHLVFAEPFNSATPPKDTPIPYTNGADAQSASSFLPRSVSSTTLPAAPFDTSQTRSTDGPAIRRDSQPQAFLQPTARTAPQGVQRSTTIPNFHTSDPFSARSNVIQSSSTSTSLSAQQQHDQQPRLRPSRLPNAKRAVLISADEAFLPAKQSHSGWLAFIPFLLALFASSSSHDSSSGSGSGSNALAQSGQQHHQHHQQQQQRSLQDRAGQIPRLEDGSFDYDNAGLYWRLFAWLDGVLGTDMCGLRAED